MQLGTVIAFVGPCPITSKAARPPMNDPFVPRVGGIMSADIAVPEHDRVVCFYARVLRTGENPLWREDLTNNHGRPVIGVGAQSAEYSDLPLQWMPHIQLADVAKSVERALELGGSEVMHGKADDGTSQWAVLLDPNGAAFGLIPLVTEGQIPAVEGGGPRGEPSGVGRIAGLSLTTENAEATRDFYRDVVGWSIEEVESVGYDGTYSDFSMLGGDGHPCAEIRHARGMNADSPSVWLLHLPVGDMSESIGRVSAEGGQVADVTFAGDGEIVRAIVQDPVGVHVALVRT